MWMFSFIKEIMVLSMIPKKTFWLGLNENYKKYEY